MAVVQFSALKSMMFSYLEQTGLKSSLMGLAKSHWKSKEKATGLWKEGLQN